MGKYTKSTTGKRERFHIVMDPKEILSHFSSFYRGLVLMCCSINWWQKNCCFDIISLNLILAMHYIRSVMDVIWCGGNLAF